MPEPGWPRTRIRREVRLSITKELFSWRERSSRSKDRELMVSFIFPSSITLPRDVERAMWLMIRRSCSTYSAVP